MKISATQYAKSLYETTAGKSEPEIDGVVAGFVKLLRKSRKMKLADKIIAKFSEIYNRENSTVEAEITTRYKIQDTRYKQVEDFIKKKYSVREVILNNIVDEKIKGGIIIKVGDEILDGSVARQLRELKNNLIK